MANVALKHICLWMFLLLLFFLILYGVHLFFFARSGSRIEQKISDVPVTMQNHIPWINPSTTQAEPTLVRNQVIHQSLIAGGALWYIGF
jgi:hypothetical protein